MCNPLLPHSNRHHPCGPGTSSLTTACVGRTFLSDQKPALTTTYNVHSSQTADIMTTEEGWDSNVQPHSSWARGPQAALGLTTARVGRTFLSDQKLALTTMFIRHRQTDINVTTLARLGQSQP